MKAGDGWRLQAVREHTRVQCWKNSHRLHGRDLHLALIASSTRQCSLSNDGAFRKILDAFQDRKIRKTVTCPYDARVNFGE